MPADKIVANIKSKSKRDWEELSRERWTDIRIWVQENGELAAIVALIAGILIALAFKFFLIVVLLGGIAAFLIWFYAEAGSNTGSPPPPAPSDPSPPPPLAGDD